jgi:hypothetical protein
MLFVPLSFSLSIPTRPNRSPQFTGGRKVLQEVPPTRENCGTVPGEYQFFPDGDRDTLTV